MSGTPGARVGARLGLALGFAAVVGTASAATLTVEVASGDGTPLDDAVVHVYPAAGRAPTRPAAGAVIDQVRKEFVPLVSAIQVGTAVRFPNRDNLRHHVYSFSPAKRFEIRLYSGEPSEPVVFDRAGLVVLGCNIHDHMVAYVMVLDTPWFGVTEREGRVRIGGLPPGDYQLAAWHHRAGDESSTVRQTVTVGADVAAAVRIAVKPAR